MNEKTLDDLVRKGMDDHCQVIVASHDSFKDLSLFFTFDVGETWTKIIDDTITRLRAVAAA